MAVISEGWRTDIQEKLYEGNEFINMSQNHDSEIVNGTVHIPQGGTQAAVTVNRSSFPATAAKRTDTDFSYTVDNYSVDPIHVQDFEELQLSYQKRSSVMGQQMDIISERIGTQTSYNWAPAGDNVKVIPTTGATTSAGPDGIVNRKKITLVDIASMAQKLDKDLVPKANRKLLMTSVLYYELFTIDQIISKDYMNGAALPMGVVAQLFGFDIYVRQTVINYDITTLATPAKLAIGAAATANDGFGCIAWHRDYVSKAEGAINVYYQENNPLYYGDVLSADVAFGSSPLRNDARSIGVVGLVQGK